MKLLIIGAGMYVCGRGTDGLGTVLPAIYQSAKDGIFVEELIFAATSSDSIATLKTKKAELEDKMGLSIPSCYYPEQGRDPASYLTALAASDLDAAIIVVPDHLHAPIATDVANAGLHCFLVKPFVTSLSDGIALVNLVNQKNLYGAVEFHKRYDTANLLIRQQLEDGKIGEILHAHIEYSQRKCIPEEIFAEWAAQTNIFQYLGVHYVDMLYFLTGALPLRVMATGQKVHLKAKGIDTYDAIQVVIEWSQGFISTHLTNWIDPNTSSAMSDQKIKIIGTKGRIESDQKHRGLQLVCDDTGVEDVNPYFSQFFTDPVTGNLRFAGYGCDSFRQFLQDVEKLNRREIEVSTLNGNRPSYASSLVSQAVIEAAHNSLSGNNEWIETIRL